MLYATVTGSVLSKIHRYISLMIAALSNWTQFEWTYVTQTVVNNWRIIKSYVLTIALHVILLSHHPYNDLRTGSDQIGHIVWYWFSIICPTARALLYCIQGVWHAYRFGFNEVYSWHISLLRLCTCLHSFAAQLVRMVANSIFMCT